MLKQSTTLALCALMMLGLITALAQPADAHNGRWYNPDNWNQNTVYNRPCNHAANGYGWGNNTNGRYTPREVAYLANLRKRYLADGELSRRERRNLEQARLRARTNQRYWY